MAAVPTGIRIGDVMKLCELYGHGADIIEKVLYLERTAYPLRYPPKK
jgi:hypothetical protein